MIVTVALDKRKRSSLSTTGFISKVVRWYTKSNYSHVEMIIGDKWIASGNPAGHGVTINQLRPLNHENWDYFDVEVDGRKTKKVMKFLETQLGTEYDWKGIFWGATLNLDIHDHDKWFCSELVFEIMNMYGKEEFGCDAPATTQPEDVYRVIKEIQNDV